MSSAPGERWSDEFLDSMRQVTDPELDDIIGAYFDPAEEAQPGGGHAALRILQPYLDQWNKPVPQEPPQGVPEASRPGWALISQFFQTPINYPNWVDHDKIRLAEDLFVSYGPVTTAVLLLNAVPHFFTNPAGARSFYMAQIFGKKSLENRMVQVPQFVVNIGQRGGLAQLGMPGPPAWFEKGPGIITVQKLRMAHAGIRVRLKGMHSGLQAEPGRCGKLVWEVSEFGQPINQEDLAEALMHFCLTTIDGLRKAGIDQTRQEDEAMFNAWKTVGFLLGLREDLQPRTIEEGLWLRDAIFRRHSRSTCDAGALIDQMLTIVAAFLPFHLKSLPAALMRYQLGPEVADMVQVPDPRLWVWLITMLRAIWKKDKLFAKLAKWISPHLVEWLVTHPVGDSEEVKFHIPRSLRQSWNV